MLEVVRSHEKRKERVGSVGVGSALPHAFTSQHYDTIPPLSPTPPTFASHSSSHLLLTGNFRNLTTETKEQTNLHQLSLKDIYTGNGKYHYYGTVDIENQQKQTFQKLNQPKSEVTESWHIQEHNTHSIYLQTKSDVGRIIKLFVTTDISVQYITYVRYYDSFQNTGIRKHSIQVSIFNIYRI